MRNKFLVVSFYIFSLPVFADLPLAIEDLITDKGKLKLDMSLAYTNIERDGLETAEPLLVQTGATSFVTLPTKIGELKSNTDALIATVGLRYGLTSNAEIYTRASYLYRDNRSSGLSGIENETTDQLVDSWLGLNYQFSQDNETPALLGFVEEALYEKHIKDTSSGKSTLFGMTTYRAIDPIVLSLSTAYRWNQARDDGDISYQPGNYLLFNPSLAFAVNDRITLTGGLQWINKKEDRYNGAAQGFRRTSTDMTLGFGYGVAKGNTLNLSFNTAASGQNRADLRLNWLYAF